LADDRKQRNGGHGRQGQRSVNVPQTGDVSPAVHEAGFFQLLGQASEKIKQQNHVEHGHRPGYDQCPERVDQPRVPDRHVARNQPSREQGCKHEEPGILRAEFKVPRLLRQRISNQQGQEHADPGTKHNPLHGHPHRHHELGFIQDVLIRAKREIDGPQLHDPGRRRSLGAERDCKNMQDRKKAQQPEADQKSIVEAEKDFAAERRCMHTDTSFLKYAVIGELGCQGVGRDDENKRDQRFKKADCRGYPVLGALHPDPVNKRVQNVSALIDLRAV